MLVLGTVGMFYGRGKTRYFFGILAVCSFLFAMGDHTPFFKLCYKFVPLIKSTRAPSMVMFLFSFAASILAGIGMQALIDRRSCENIRIKLPLYIII